MGWQQGWGTPAGRVELGLGEEQRRGQVCSGQVGVAGHLTVGNNVTAAAQSGIIGDIPDQTAVIGFPAMPLAHGRRVFAIVRNLPELLDRVKKIEDQVEELGNDQQPQQRRPRKSLALYDFRRYGPGRFSTSRPLEPPAPTRRTRGGRL